ncbi:MAG TPA: mechanosensitive ion channel, partial [Thermodesulfobacteriota bacterium]|nr:mechanosensitive ion channel [Thermodesulfobacteriota bacterium]
MFARSIISQIDQTIPNLLGAILVLLIGLVIALVLGVVSKEALRKTGFSNRLCHWLGKPEGSLKVDEWIGKALFYLILFFVLVAFFQALGLTLITEPFNRLLTNIFAYAPRLIAPIVLLLIAWILASILRLTLKKTLTAAKFDERLSSQTAIDEEKKTILPLSRSISDALYWLIFLLFLPAVLDALALEGLMRPLRDMIDRILSYLPNLLGALIVLIFGWFLARVIQKIVTNLLNALGADRFSERIGLTAVLREYSLSNIIGLIAYVLILIPVLIASLNALAIEAVTGPASHMLNLILSAIPIIFAALLLLAIAYIIGRVIAHLVTDLLASIGFNALLARVGVVPREIIGTMSPLPSDIVGTIVLIGIMFFAFIEAFDLLGFEDIAALVTEFMIFAGEILLGLLIFGIGLLLANLTHRTISNSGTSHSRLLASAARAAILVFAGSMA